MSERDGKDALKILGGSGDPMWDEAGSVKNKPREIPEGMVPPEESWVSFLESLYAPLPGLREMAVFELPVWHQLGRDVSEVVALSMRDPEPLVCRAAVVVAGRLRMSSEPVLQAITERLRTEQEPLLRRTMATALSRIGRPGFPGLVWLLGDRDAFVRQFAAVALGDAGEEAIPCLLEALTDERIRPFLAPVLGQIGGPAVPGLLAALDASNAAVQELAMDVLERIGPLTVEPLIEAVQKGSVSRRNGADALSRFGTGGVASLVRLMRGGDVSMRCWAADVVVMIGRPAVPSVITMLREEHVGISYLAGETLVRLGACAIPELVQSLGTVTRSVRWIVGNILGRLGVEAVHALESAVAEGDPLTREAAAHTLGEMGETAWAALPTLEAVLKTEQEPFVQDTIKKAIERLRQFE
ncbi:MAG TPA: HEAT repeat domain-containing protein [Candidatus Ozemobacteraceae bacterium]|nr:HEAT repeat domain-containing protein [Candidatus Ozemobacteraceae bacterium]